MCSHIVFLGMGYIHAYVLTSIRDLTKHNHAVMILILAATENGKVSDKSAPQIDKTSEFQLNLQWDRDLWPSITSSTKSFWSGLKYKKAT